MPSLFLRRATAPQEAIGPVSPDELPSMALAGEDCISLRGDSPFAPVERELDRDPLLRDALLQALPLRAASRYTKWRPALFVGVVPLLTLAALDRELMASGHPGAPAALVLDALLVVAASVDLARRTPRMPHVVAAAFASGATRVLLLIASRCGDVHPLLIVSLVLALAGTFGVLWIAPTPRAVADHLRHALALAPPTRLPPASSRGFFAYIAYAIAAAAALPLLLFSLLQLRAPISLQLIAFVLFAFVVPYVGRVVIGRELPPLRMAIAQAAGIEPEQYSPSFALSWRAIRRAAAAAAAMLVLSFALVRGAQHLLDAAAQLHSCVASDPAFVSPLQRLVDAERAELATSRHGPDFSLFLLTVAVVPVAEELVYRGLVQHALRRRVPRRVAIGVAAVLFGLAHLLVYKTVAWQTVLLGLTFGLAYESGGLLASTLVHMLWNLWLSL